MPVESELKLRIAPEHMARLKRSTLLKQISAGRAVTRKLRNIYFDTPDFTLHRHRMALRLRQVGSHWLQTLKGGGAVEAGLHSRNEWEMPVAGEQLEIAALEASGGILPPGADTDLQPVFSTDFTRSLKVLHFEGATVELCLDSGDIRADDKSRIISELELELKSGQPRQLFQLALRLMDIVPLEVENINKAEYGYQLYAGTSAMPSKAHMPDISGEQRTASALRAMVASCLDHVQRNVPGALHSIDDEFLHQVRVGLRRLRVVLSMVARLSEDDELTALRQQVSELCVELGRARDWDVFVGGLLSAVMRKFPDDRGVQMLAQQCERERETQRVSMRTALASQEFQRLLLRLGCWMYGDQWQTMSLGREYGNLRGYAMHLLEKRVRKVAHLGGQVASGKLEQSHLLRIACKKLRYAAEMFQPLFESKRTDRYLADLGKLQDALGALHDITIARRLLAELDADGEIHIARSLMLGWLEHDISVRESDMTHAWSRFAMHAPFWRK